MHTNVLGQLGHEGLAEGLNLNEGLALQACEHDDELAWADSIALDM